MTKRKNRCERSLDCLPGHPGCHEQQATRVDVLCERRIVVVIAASEVVFSTNEHDHAVQAQELGIQLSAKEQRSIWFIHQAKAGAGDQSSHVMCECGAIAKE